MSNGRALTWDGFFNARDLGGLPTPEGRRTCHGAFIRSGDLRFVTKAGWKAAWPAGVRTVVDLRNPDEMRPQCDGPGPTALAGSAQFVAPTEESGAPQQMERIELPLDDVGDTAFWREMNANGLNGLPHYYGPFLARKSERCAAVVTAANAAPGGVLFHCGAGRDRTGLVAILLLGLAGVEPSAIVSDYQLTSQGLPPLLAALALPDQSPLSDNALAAHPTTVDEELRAILREYDTESYLRGAGVAVGDISTVRARILGP